ncbi:hypothetical protein pb186bvf_008317 [Paramecium bursaria]
MEYEYTSHDSHQKPVPYKRQQSPIVTQLVRKDKELEQLREEILHQQQIIDDLNLNLDYLDKENKHYYNAFQQQQLQIEQLQSELQNRDLIRIKAPVKQTVAQTIINQFLQEDQTILTPQNIIAPLPKFVDKEFYQNELDESIEREYQMKLLFEQLVERCLQNNFKLCDQMNKMKDVQQKQLDELQKAFHDKEKERLLYKSKTILLTKCLLKSVDINSKLQGQINFLKQQSKQLIVQNSDNLLKTIIEFIQNETQESNHNVVEKAIKDIQQLHRPLSRIRKLTSLIENKPASSLDQQVEVIINTIKTQDKLIKKQDDDKQIIIDELMFYKDKLSEQDQTINDLNLILKNMENYEEILDQLNQTQNELQYAHKLLDQQSKLYCQLEQNSIVEYNTVPINETSLETILQYILVLVSGFDSEKQEFYLNSNESEKFIRIPKISSPIILNIIQQIQKKHRVQSLDLQSYIGLFNLFQELAAKQCLDEPFEDDHTVQQLESFYEISFKHVVKKQTITDVEKQQYLRVYPFVSRIVGEIQEKLTVNLIKQVREKGIHKMQKFDYIQDNNQFII